MGYSYGIPELTKVERRYSATLTRLYSSVDDLSPVRPRSVLDMSALMRTHRLTQLPVITWSMEYMVHRYLSGRS
jgi:hypothetical protein